jgi:4-alpha-glucanotransferase
MDEVAAAARLWGVEPEYFEAFGHGASPARQRLDRLVAAVSKGRNKPVQFDQPAPRGAYQGTGRRLWAIALQLYAVRSPRNWGHGDFTDLGRLVSRVAAHGAAAIGVQSAARTAEEASPYAPNSRLFLNPLCIDVEAIRNFPAAPLQAASPTSSRCVCPS